MNDINIKIHRISTASATGNVGIYSVYTQGITTTILMYYNALWPSNPTQWTHSRISTTLTRRFFIGKTMTKMLASDLFVSSVYLTYLRFYIALYIQIDGLIFMTCIAANSMLIRNKIRRYTSLASKWEFIEFKLTIVSRLIWNVYIAILKLTHNQYHKLKVFKRK